MTEAMEIIREQRLNERADIEEQKYYRQRDWNKNALIMNIFKKISQSIPLKLSTNNSIKETKKLAKKI